MLHFTTTRSYVCMNCPVSFYSCVDDCPCATYSALFLAKPLSIPLHTTKNTINVDLLESRDIKRPAVYAVAKYSLSPSGVMSAALPTSQEKNLICQNSYFLSMRQTTRLFSASQPEKIMVPKSSAMESLMQLSVWERRAVERMRMVVWNCMFEMVVRSWIEVTY